MFSLTCTGIAWLSTQKFADEAENSHLELKVNAAVNDISQRMQLYDEVLLGAAGLFNASKVVDRDEFKTYVATLNLQKNYPGIQGVGFSLLVPPQQKNQHEHTVQQQGFPQYKIYPASERAIYSSIIYLEPFAGRNLRAFGYDMYAEPIRRIAMERACDNDETALSGKVKLVQEVGKNDQFGFLAYQPIYKNNLPHNTLIQRRANLIGWVYAPFRMGDLMTEVLADYGDNFIFKIYDGATTDNNALMFESASIKAINHSLSHLQRHQHILFGGHTWTVSMIPLPSTFLQLNRTRPSLVLITGTLLSIFFTLIFWLLAKGRSHAIQANRTLRETQNLLQQEQQRLAEILWGTNAGTWEWNIQTGAITVNERAAEILEYTLPEITPLNYEVWKKTNHPDSLIESDAQLRRYFNHEIDSYSCEIKVRNKNHNWIWVLIRARVVEWATDGQPLRMSGTMQDITNDKLLTDTIHHFAYYDLLTDLPNRMLFSDRLQQAFTHAARDQTLLALMYIDLDQFKQINDNFGHLVGDLVLSESAKKMHSCLRDSDTVARIGGDEFVVLLPKIEAAENALKVGNEILDALRVPISIQQHQLFISASIGIAIYPNDGTDELTLSKHADEAMYQAKLNGRNQALLYRAAT